VTNDTELEVWQREWRDQTEPLPDFKKKIRRQNLQMAAGVLAICVCLAVSTVIALRTRTPFMAGLASGIAFASVVLGGYAWRVQRGAWKPTSQTTLAYAELSHRRAVAKVKTLRFSFYFLLVTVLLLATFLGWNWKRFRARAGIVTAALVTELFFLKYLGQRKQREAEQTSRLLDDMRR
jgi:predicted lysophospholipase L1 biosynthesis ABC-type transport system permease subunit